MISLALILLAAKAPAPPQVYCEPTHQVLHLPYADIVVGGADTTLRESKPVPKAAKAEPQAVKTLDVKGDTSVLTIRPEGWSLVKGAETIALAPPKTAVNAEARLYGVQGGFAWIAGQYWITRVNLSTGEIVAGKLLRDGRTVFVMDVGDSVLFTASDRITRCGPDAVCTEVGRLPWSATYMASGATAYVFGNDSISDRVVRVMKDKLESAITVDAGPNAVVCPLAGAMAVYLPANPWTVTRVPADPPPAPLAPEGKNRLLATGLASSPEIKANSAIFDTALREKWPELEAFGLIAANDTRPEIRASVASAFASVPTTRGFATLWLLGRDTHPLVRSSALDATARWCSKQRVVPCTSALKHYMTDPDTEVSWLARDHLLVYDPMSALKDANTDYKRDVISHLAQLMVTHANPALKEALTQLTYDGDPTVRMSALQTLSGMGF